MSLADYFNPHSCEHCSQLLVDFTKLKERKITFEITRLDAESFAGNGCALFASLIKSAWDSRLYSNGSKLQAVVSTENLVFQVLNKHSEGLRDTKRLASYWMTAGEDHLTGKYLRRPVNLRPGSDASLLQIKNWLQTCQTHDTCKRSDRAFKPTRLVEISYRQNRRLLSLRESTNLPSNVDYTALSYCWGGEQLVQTTEATMRRHLLRINFSDLPPTLKDAIIVTENLGLKHIWIDALCIVQDDPRDKALEIGRMPLVYSQASVTILASRAKSVDEGFLQDRPLSRVVPKPDQVFKVPCTGSDGTSGSLILAQKSTTPSEPLKKRAWALQEELLSPRLLQYGTLQTQWMCRQSDQDEMFTDGSAGHGRGPSTLELSVATREAEQRAAFYQKIDGLVLKSREEASQPALKELTRQEWYRLVQRYTGRKLTLDSDRLPAISGIAQRLNNILDDEYLAGLWRSTLEYDLLWERSRFAPGSNCSRRESPSWSWASINAPITPYFRGKNAISCIEVVDCEVHPLVTTGFSFGKYGQVSSGKLVLRGRLTPVQWRREKGTRDDTLRRVDTDGAEEVLHVMTSQDVLDEDLISNDTLFEPVFLLKVIEDSDRTTCLILRNIEGSTYSREGTCCFSSGGYQRRWLDEGELGTINII